MFGPLVLVYQDAARKAFLFINEGTHSQIVRREA